MNAVRLFLWMGLMMASARGESFWLENFQKAKGLAAEQNRPLLVNFSGSDWCGWCIRLDREVFSTEPFQAFARNNLVGVVVDFPRRRALPAEQQKENEALRDQFRVNGFPTVFLLDAEGKEIARTGYRPGGPEAYIQYLQELIKKAASAESQP